MLTRLKWLLFLIERKLKRLRLQLLFFRRRMITPSFPKEQCDKILIHIGCGEIDSREFINIDAQPFPHVYIVSDNIGDLSMFASGTVDLIYMSHILEHIKRKDLDKMLLEMRRVLKKDGVLRVSVPDFDRIIQIYNDTGNEINSISAALMGGQSNKRDFHYSLFNYQYLSKLLTRAGFRELREWDPFDCNYHDFENTASQPYVFEGKQYVVSLNLEAVK